MSYQLIIGLCWAVFIVYWGISALSAKRTVSRGPALWIVRVVILLFALAAVSKYGAREVSTAVFAQGPTAPLLGTICAIAGIGLAVWARVYLGHNWGMPMSKKENPELVTGGPYSYIRHPIYTGVLLAILGSSLVVASFFWLGIFVVGGAYFIFSAVQEEKLMLKTFPETYPAYKRRTKMLVPFIV